MKRVEELEMALESLVIFVSNQRAEDKAAGREIDPAVDVNIEAARAVLRGELPRHQGGGVMDEVREYPKEVNTPELERAYCSGYWKGLEMSKKNEREKACGIIGDLLDLAQQANGSCRDVGDCGHSYCRDIRETIRKAEKYLKEAMK